VLLRGCFSAKKALKVCVCERRKYEATPTLFQLLPFNVTQKEFITKIRSLIFREGKKSSFFGI
jgi:hypothetical protein